MERIPESHVGELDHSLTSCRFVQTQLALILLSIVVQMY